MRLGRWVGSLTNEKGELMHVGSEATVCLSEHGFLESGVPFIFHVFLRLKYVSILVSRRMHLVLHLLLRPLHAFRIL